MQFDLDRNIDGAALDVQSNISATLRKLPPQLPAPPSFQKLNPADSPILFIALVSKTLPLTPGRRLRRAGVRRADLADHRRRAGAGVRPAEIRGARRRRSRHGRGARPDARQRQQRRGGGQFLDAGRRAARRTAERHRRRDRPDAARRPNTTISSSPGATARRCGSTRSRTSTIRSRTSRSPPGSATSARSCSRCSASPTPTPSRSSTTSRRRFPITNRNCRPRCRR